MAKEPRIIVKTFPHKGYRFIAKDIEGSKVLKQLQLLFDPLWPVPETVMPFVIDFSHGGA